MSEPHPSSLGHVPAGNKWEFDETVTDCFEDMLQRSIPQYAVMRETVAELAARYVQPRTAVVDLGCSRGDAMAPLIRQFGALNQFVGVEVSEPMLRAARQRFAGLINAGIVDVRPMDLRKDYPSRLASVTMAVLTLQFTPIEYRHRIVSNVFKHTVPGGAFILVEKLLGPDAEIDDAMTASYVRHKEQSGYTPDEIQRKRMALEGVLVPVTARWNEELLRAAGFNHVECFWRWMNFGGWIAVRDP
jgi:tRNA (cmo5U34)-methyltransferase